MTRFLILTASTFCFASVAVAADLYTKAPQPPPPTPVVGKAPIGKAPIGKAPIGKAPIGKGPVIARG